MFGFRQRNKTCRLLAQTQGRHVEMYARFRAFLTHNYEALAALARLEQIYHSGNPFGMAQVRRAYAALSEASRGLVQALIDLAQGRFAGLMPVFEAIDAEAQIGRASCRGRV